MTKKKKKEKTKEEVLAQTYISASDLKILMPTVGIDKCRKYIDEIRAEMERKNLYVPNDTIPRLALTKVARKKFGI